MLSFKSKEEVKKKSCGEEEDKLCIYALRFMTHVMIIKTFRAHTKLSFYLPFMLLSVTVVINCRKCNAERD